MQSYSFGRLLPAGSHGSHVRRGSRLLWGWLVLLLLQGCVGTSARFDDAAAARGLWRERFGGNGFQLVVYSNRQPPAGDRVLHVYIGGDGTPWLAGRWVAADPTARNPLILGLMAQDRSPAILLGRPCYQGTAADPECRPALWTDARYSDEVVDSMAAVLKRLLRRDGYRRLVLIGYSGGGTLAMLLAPRFAATEALVTVSGNLDPEAWARLHHYRPLSGSLNPRDLPALPESVIQYHLAAGQDRNVPPWLIRSALQHQPAAQFVVWPEFDHRCCWERVWRHVLACVRDRCRLRPQ